MSIQTTFSIKDLENLSGIKAHTIRIWEKRYNLLEPNRTDTNIREYSLDSLKKLLNISFLYNSGLKISKIAALDEDEIINLIEEYTVKDKDAHTIQLLKTAMFEFNYPLFQKTIQEFEKTNDFRTLFFDIFIPLLTELGTLWHTGTIDPAHEHFISELIKQKIIVNIDSLKKESFDDTKPTFCLYLPHHEMHEIGLLYCHYEVLKAGFNTVYLGPNIPLENLKHIVKHYQNVLFLSYFTVKPKKTPLAKYIVDYSDKIDSEKKQSLWLMGRETQELKEKNTFNNITVVQNHTELIEKLKILKKS